MKIRKIEISFFINGPTSDNKVKKFGTLREFFLCWFQLSSLSGSNAFPPEGGPTLHYREDVNSFFCLFVFPFWQT